MKVVPRHVFQSDQQKTCHSFPQKCIVKSFEIVLKTLKSFVCISSGFFSWLSSASWWEIQTRDVLQVHQSDLTQSSFDGFMHLMNQTDSNKD